MTDKPDGTLLQFSEGDGDLWYSYTYQGRFGSVFEKYEKIPDKVVKKGEKAVHVFVSKEISKVRKRREELERNIIETPLRVYARYGRGIRLQGYIVEASGDYLKVKLTKPVKGEFELRNDKLVNGPYVEGDEISQNGWMEAKECLVFAYEKSIRRPVVSLAKSLNRGG